MKSTPRRLLATAIAALLAGPVLAVAPAHAADDVTLNLIGINDFHGRIDANTTKWATTIEKLRQAGGDDNSLLVSAGDNVGASLFASATQQDVPTIEVLNELELDASAVGNHELDKGADDLTGRLSALADFPFLSANIFESDDSTLLEPYEIFTIDGVDVAVVGAVTEETPALVTPSGIQGLTFGDPVDAINDTVDDLQALADAPDVIVASYHEGAPNGALTLPQAIDQSMVFRKMVEQTDPAVDAIFMGHTHQKYVYDAPVPGDESQTRPIVQTGQYGENVGNIVLTYSPDSGEVEDHTAKVVAREGSADTSLPRVAAVQDTVTDALAYAADVGNEPVGEQTADITRALVGGAEDRTNESTLGGLVADAMLAAVSETPAGADIGLTNPGGLRVDLLFAGTGDRNEDGVITFAEANAVLPFVNNLSTVTLSGASLKKVFEQQWQRDANNQVPTRAYLQLGVSKNVNYTYDPSRPEGDRITSLLVDGEQVVAGDSYRVAVPSFLTSGGDNFRAFTEGTSVDSGLVDYQAFIDYLGENSPVSPDFARRSVQVDGIKDVYAAGSSVSFSLPKLNLTSTGSPSNTSVSARLAYDDTSRSLGTKSVSGGASGTFTFTLPEGVTGPMTITATAFPSGTKVTIPLDVRAAPVFAITADDVTYGDEATVDVAVSGASTAATGTVTLKKGDTELGTAPLVDGAASFSVDSTDVGAGDSELTVTYGGDATYAPGSGSGTLAVAKAGTQVAAEAPEVTGYDETIGVEVDVTSATETTPTGAVTVSEGDVEVASGTLTEGAGTVDVDPSDLGIGDHTLTVAYAGDDDHEPSTTSVEVSVDKGAAELTAEVTSSAYGSATVKVTASDPEAEGLVYLGNGPDAAGMGFLIDGVATIKVDKTLKPGDYDLDVYYNGSDTFDATQTTVDLTVVKAATTTSKQFVTAKVVVKKTKAWVTFDVKAAGFTVEDGSFRIGSNGKWYTTKVVNGRANVQVGAYNSTGTKTIKGEFLGNAVAAPSKGQFTIKVVAK